MAAAVEYIRAHYAEPITVDDMLRALPLSKYYFIRTFRRVMAERIIRLAPPITAITCALIVALSLVYHFVLA